MPSKSSLLTINDELLDRRVVLTQEMKKMIRKQYATGLFSIRELTRRWGVSRRLIQFTLFPERIAKSRENRNWRDYYTKEKHREDIKEHRHYKDKLYKMNLLKGGEIKNEKTAQK